MKKMSINKQHGYCPLCGELRDLCFSHALPDSAFRLLLREGSGKAISIIGDQDTPIQYSTDSWDVALLCSGCEGKLNRNYDTYGIGVLKGQKCSKVRHIEAGVTFYGIDRQHFRMFFLSLLWRISVSHHRCYRNIALPNHWEQEIHDALYNDSIISWSKFNVALYRLRDSTPGGFSKESLRTFIVAPFGRSFNGFTSVCFVFLGFFVEIFLPRIPTRFSKKCGVLSGNIPIFLAPYYEIMDIPEVVNIIVNGLRKDEQGISRI